MKPSTSRRGIAALALAFGVLSGAHTLPLAADTADGRSPSVELAAASAAGVDAEALYLVNCRTCHGTKGTAGTPLAGNENLADAAHVARTIIVGPGYMTPFGEHLDDEQIAAIATYVRTNWGNSFGPVDVQDVAAAR